MVSQENFDKLRIELSVKAKNGLNFTLAAGIVWLAIAYVWTLDYTDYNKSVLTFIVGSFMLPMALGLSKVLKAAWTIKDNPLQPLGLWLNFAQLFYFPFLIFILIKMPESFVMTYVIITGAHFFPYSWYYKTPYFAMFGGIISVGALFLELFLLPKNTYLIPLFMAVLLLILTVFLFVDSNSKQIKLDKNIEN